MMKALGWIAGLIALVIVPSMANERPNVVIIVIDDLGYADLSCLGETAAADVSTPHLDRLARDGVRFAQAYATAPICNASRIALMTGRYQQRQGVRWYGGKGLHRSDFATLAEVLAAAGYRTGYVGKFHHGSTDHPGGRGFPLNHGFDSFFGFSGGTKHYLHHSTAHADQPDQLHQGPMWDQDQRVNGDGFTTEMFGERARAFIQESGGQPFYLHLSFNAVHNFTHQLPESYLDAQGLPSFADLTEGEDYWAWRQRIGFPAHPHGRAYYLGQLSLLDQEIGRVMETLDQSGLREDTLVIVASDNGGSLVTYADNAPLKGGKYTLFEGGLRVPLLLRYPEVFYGGQVREDPVSLLDVFATVTELVGVEAPEGLDGRSLAEAPGDTAESAARKFFWDTGAQSAIREGRWKLLITRKSPNGRLQIESTPQGTFLFDLESDPGESADLAAQRPELVEALSASLQAWTQTVYP